MPTGTRRCALCGQGQRITLESPGPHLSRAMGAGEIICPACVEARGLKIGFDPLMHARFVVLEGDQFDEFGGVFLGRVHLKTIA